MSRVEPMKNLWIVWGPFREAAFIHSFRPWGANSTPSQKGAQVVLAIGDSGVIPLRAFSYLAIN